jgi:hypothetical protein
VNLAVSDGQGGTGQASTSLLVASASPSAEIIVAPRTTVAEGTVVTLNTKVTDPTLAGVLTYDWTITPNNGQPVVTEEDHTGSFQFTPKEEGTYQVLLTVKDSKGHVGVGLPTNITVDKATPNVTMSGVPLTSSTGKPITLQGFASDADPHQPGSGSADPYVLTWSVLTPNGQANPNTGSGPAFTFTPAGADNYVVTLKATDEHGLATSTSVVIPVTQVTRTLSLTPPSTPLEATPFSWTVSVDNPPANVTFTYVWKLTSPDGTITTIDTGTNNTLNYTPILIGPYRLSVTATGSDRSTGTVAPPASGTQITVANIPPNITVQVPPGSIVEGDTVNISSTISDQGDDLTNPIYSWTVTGPDGFVATGVQSTMSFLPLEAGTYTATIQVSDANNGYRHGNGHDQRPSCAASTDSAIRQRESGRQR